MNPTFTRDDVDKPVENATGDVIGVVTEVESDTAHVEPNSGVMDSLRAVLGWDRAHHDTVVVHEDSVSEITSTVIRLEGGPYEETEGIAVDGQSETAGTDRSADRETDGKQTDSTAELEPTRETEFDDAANRDERTGSDPVANADADEKPAADFDSDESTDAEDLHPGQMADPSGELDTGEGETIERAADADSSSEFDADDSSPDEANAHHGTDQRSDDESNSPGGAEGVSDVDVNVVEEMNYGDDVDPTEESGAEITDERDSDSDATAHHEVGDGREQSGGIPVDDEAVEPREMDLLEEQEHGIGADSVDDAELDELEGDRPSDEREEADRYDLEDVDVRSLEELEELDAIEGPDGSRGAHPVEDVGDDEYPADELGLGPDAETLEEVAGADAESGDDATGPGPGIADSKPETEEMDLVDELDRGTDVESLEERSSRPEAERPSNATSESEAETEIPITIGPDSVAGTRKPAESEGSQGPQDIVGRIVSGSETEVGSGPERRSEQSDRRAGDSSRTPIAAMFDVQRTAITEGQRAFERTLAAQQTLTLRSLETMRTATERYFDGLARMGGVGASGGRDRTAKRRGPRVGESTGRDDRVRELEDRLDRQTEVLEEIRDHLRDDSGSGRFDPSDITREEGQRPLEGFEEAED
ncbi:hypothetical protein ACFQGT_04745 [Natrialbaceae archaeon GCM10025810]|uniref:hypothetical protein n=1 Tax=Halovalidus salilacus TaxID=3075124 RepID=UPI003608745B